MRPLPQLRPSGPGRLVPRTVRLRLTLLYGALFAVSGAVLLAITYLLVSHSTGNLLLYRGGIAPVRIGAGGTFHTDQIPAALAADAQQIGAQAARQHAAELHQLLVQSGIALAIMAVVSIAL